MSRIADAHNDLLLELVFRSGEDNPFARHWLEPLERGGVRLQVCAVFSPFEHLPEGALRLALQQVAACHRAARENSDRVVLVRTRAELELAERSGRLGLVLALEGAEPLGYDPALADVFWELGVRLVSLTWQRRNAFADGNGEPPTGGLSELGRRLVGRLASLGMIIDLAHASDRTFAEVLELAPDATVLVSHTACRALLDTPRNASDEQLRALAAREGVAGIFAVPLFVDPKRRSLERLVDHIEHAIAVAGEAHVALGGDFVAQLVRSGAVRVNEADLRLPPGYTLDTAIDGLAGPEDYPRLVAALRARGHDGDALDGLLHGNLARVLRRGLPA